MARAACPLVGADLFVRRFNGGDGVGFGLVHRTGLWWRCRR